MDIIAKNAATLTFDLIANGHHMPLVNGKANRVQMEDTIINGIMSGELTYFVDEEIANIAFALIDDLVETHGDNILDVLINKKG